MLVALIMQIISFALAACPARKVSAKSWRARARRNEWLAWWSHCARLVGIIILHACGWFEQHARTH